MIILLIFTYLVIVLIGLVNPPHSTMSHFELERRSKSGNKNAADILKRELLLPNVIVLRNLILLVFSLVFAALAIDTYGLLAGILMMALVLISLGPISHIRALSRLINKAFLKIEPSVLKFVDRLSPFFGFFNELSGDLLSSKADSKEELEHIVATMNDEVVTPEEKTIILSALKFSEKQVSDAMVPAEKVETVKKGEILGPITLDKLHKTGFNYFPVIDKDINHVVGVLRTKQDFSVNSKKSPKVEAVMDKEVYFVREDHDLRYALSAFVRTSYPIFVVINGQRETVGILTVDDIMRSLIGDEVQDDFSEDDNKEAVAKRSNNNNTKSGIDL